MRSREHGAALLEVLAAVAILGLAGTALLEVTAAHTRAATDARRREAELAGAERLLTAHALLTRTDLERRLGTTAIGPWLLEVQRPEPELFRIAIRRAERRDVEELVTVVFRERPDAP